MRHAQVQRKTNETDILVDLAIDGTGKADISTGVGFFDHMLDHLARHGLMDLSVKATGDLHIDAHHTVEDVGICIGKALLQAMANPAGIRRYGHAVVPMDEALAEVAVDVSGRPFLVFNAALPAGSLGNFDIELAREFMQALAINARITLHVNLRYGVNSHHCIEGIFKALAQALRRAFERDERNTGVPSTKGMLET